MKQQFTTNSYCRLSLLHTNKFMCNKWLNIPPLVNGRSSNSIATTAVRVSPGTNFRGISETGTGTETNKTFGDEESRERGQNLTKSFGVFREFRETKRPALSL